MKFLPKPYKNTITQQFSGINKVEHYIELTKNNINDNLPQLTTTTSKPNTTKADKQTIHKFKKASNKITIKPADKNLGIVLMHTDDYISQCTKHLADTTTYRLVDDYPKNAITRLVTNTCTNFKTQLQQKTVQLSNL